MDEENDVLGLDQPLKLGRVSRIPKLTDELLFENNRGLPQVRNNYKKLVRAIRKNDSKYADGVSKKRLTKSAAHQLKVATEVENLQKVLSFYQLWCHGLFPRATFQDCLKMLRGHKSFALKEYRRGLLENEIRRLKIEKGIIVEEPENDDIDDDLYAPADDNNTSETRQSSEGSRAQNPEIDPESDDEDWGFLSTSRRRNGLFIGEDEEEENDANQDSTTPATAVPHEAFPDENDFEDFYDPSPGKENEPDDHDEELAIMREMGM